MSKNKATADASEALPAISEASPDQSTKLRPETLPAISNVVPGSPTKPHPKSMGIFPSRKADIPKQASQLPGVSFDVSDVAHSTSQGPKPPRPKSGLFGRPRTSELSQAVQPFALSFEILPGAQFPGPIALLAAEIAHYLINATSQDLPYGIGTDKAKEIIIINETTINLLVKMLDDPDKSYSAADALAKLAEQGTLFIRREY